MQKDKYILKMVRGNYMRKGVNVKGFVRKDYDNTYNSRRKLQDPIKDITSEDTRISKTLRRLVKEDDPENFAVLCNQLQDSFTLMDNERYIVKAMEYICESIFETFRNALDYECKVLATKCLSHLGLALGPNIHRFFEWFFTKYASEKSVDIRLLLMKIIFNIVLADRKKHNLIDVSVDLANQIQCILENTDVPEILFITSEILVVLLEEYIESFAVIYKDTVDIVIGWYVDIEQPVVIIRKMASIIQLLEPYLKSDIDYVLNILEQLMDDIERYGNELAAMKKNDKNDQTDLPEAELAEYSSTDYCKRIGKAVSFLKAFNSLVKSVDLYLSPTITPIVTYDFLLSCVSKTIGMLLLSFEIENVDEELYISGNECIWLLVSHLQNRLAPIQEILFKLIYTEIERAPIHNNYYLASLLQFVAKVIRECGPNLRFELIELLIGPNSLNVKLRFSVNYHVCNAVTVIYHSLLNLKNIPLLQEAYRYILGDMERAFLVIDPTVDKFCTDNPFSGIEYDKQTADLVLLFYMKALSDLANSGSSIIGMWALQPCILELLAIKLKPTAPELDPVFRYSLFCLLYSHCTRYSNFISSSELVNNMQGRTNVNDMFKFMGSDATSMSPTGGHLTIILNLLSQLLQMNLNKESSLLIYRWVSELLTQIQTHISALLCTNEFLSFIRALIYTAGKSTQTYVMEAACNCLHIFLYNPNNCYIKSDILEEIIELCLIRLTSLDNSIKENYLKLLLRINWTTVISTTDQLFQKPKGVFKRTMLICRSHMLHGGSKEIGFQDFKIFIQYLLEGKTLEKNTDIFMDIFYKSWPPNMKNNFSDAATCYKPILLFWNIWECAQFCVLNRLRTPLGKPNETFLAFEGMLKNLGKECLTKPSEIRESPYTLQRVRLLLEFLELLEKSIYNASEGTAVALSAPSKGVKTFFRTNKTTCSEWFTRNRRALMLISWNAGVPSAVVRHGYQLLQNLFLSGNAKNNDFMLAVKYVALALCHLKEPAAIKGLQAWCREVVNSKFSYLTALSDHAAGRYEVAAESYLLLIEELESASTKSLNLSVNGEIMDNDDHAFNSLKYFISDQLTECYLNLNDWTRLKQWKKRESEFLSELAYDAIQRYGHLTINDVELLESIDLGNYSASLLEEWALPSVKTTEDAKYNWNSCQNLREMKQSYFPSLIFSSLSNDDKYVTLCESLAKKYINGVENYLIEDIFNMPAPFIPDFVTILYVARTFFSPDISSFCNFPSDTLNKKLNSRTFSNALWWCRLIETCQKINPDIVKFFSNIETIRLQLVKSARKEGNVLLASEQLLSYFQGTANLLPFGSTARSTSSSSESKLTTYNSLLQAIAEQTANIANSNLWNIGNVDALLQFAKIARSYNNNDVAIEICALNALGIVHGAGVTDPFGREKLSRISLYLAKWLSTNITVQEIPAPVHKLLCVLQNGVYTSMPSYMDCNLSNPVIPPKDIIIGNFLKLAVLESPSLAKVWNQFADWCYKWGRRVVGKQNDILTAADRALIDKLVPDEVDKEQIYSILTYMQPTTIDEEDIETTESFNTTEMVEWKLQKIGVFSEQQLSDLIEIWKQMHARIYMYYVLSAHSYFKFLQLGETGQKGTNIITATLRLLRLIVKYAPQLQNVLEVELSFTPTAPWKCIIPQLFSRLNHPEQYVCKQISELLCRIAEDAPHLIIFPAVVGSDSGATGTINDLPSSSLLKSYFTRDENIYNEEGDVIVEEEEEEELDDEEDYLGPEEINHGLENSYLAMVDTLAKQAPETISQVRLLVNELRRITLLWDELWLGALNQHHSDMARRVHQLETEITRVDANAHLEDSEKDYIVMEKYMVLMKPVLFMLEQLQAITSVKPETPHEKWFQSKYHDIIKSTIDAIQNPKNFRKPYDSWKKVKELQQCFQQRASKKTSYTLKLSNISPTLASFSDTSIAMPGLEQFITISSIHNYISILPTKTKPKKLVFQGSNGKMYTYLFKGLEDLHLDERIMQFLSVVNTMLQGTEFHARHYSVVPLGPHSGLISWVDHVTPIFAVYKRWQQRVASVNQSTISRPSELFNAKLIPLLKERGITNLENRKEWPISVLKMVLLSLMEETPSDLLAKELWCQSVNTGSWWRITRLYSSSLALMSIIGYIIGLGDRHLDNVLVHLATGEIIHIDYNVCFEKGKTLRIPEKVPFRLTQNLQTALGITGIEGIFRSSCEYVLKVMKAGKETLLTLLEAFVYDPLIDWTPGIETGYTGAVYGSGRSVVLKSKQKRKQLELEVTHSMFVIRIMEIKHKWVENRNKLEKELSSLSTFFSVWLENCRVEHNLVDTIAENQQLLALLKTAETYPHHSLYSLFDRFNVHKQATDKSLSIRDTLNAKLEECETQLNQYKMVFYHLHSEKLVNLYSEIQKYQEKKHSMFDILTEFLNSAGQKHLIQQCSQLEVKLNNALEQQVELNENCLNILKKYSTVSSLFPSSCLYHHRCAVYKKWILALLEYPGLNSCIEIIKELEILNTPIVKESALKHVKKFAANMQKNIQDLEKSLKTREEKVEKMSNVSEKSFSESEQTIQRIGKESTLSVHCAIVTELCTLNKKFLKMETAAVGAGDCLMGLTSVGGEWFLDEMCLSTEVVNKLASYILEPSILEENADLQLVTKCLTSLHDVYMRLQELNVNFATIIVPEAVKKFFVEDETVLNVTNNLNVIVNKSNIPFNNIINELKLHLHFVIMGMQSPHENCLSLVESVKTQFQSLINGGQQGSVMSQGQMLLMGFNGLFQNLYNDRNKLFSLLPSLTDLSSTWKSVDIIKESRSLIGPIFSTESQAVLQDLFLLKHIEAMHEFFSKCQLMANGYKTENATSNEVYYTDEQLNKIVRRYTADFLSKQLLGLFSYVLATGICLLIRHMGFNIVGEIEQRDIGAESKVPLKELSHKAIDCQRKSGKITGNNYTAVLNAATNVQNVCKRMAIKKKLKQEMESIDLLTENLKLQYTAYLWMYDEILPANAVLLPSLINRGEFLSELKTALNSLTEHCAQITDYKEQRNSLISSAIQRLKWASGANPSLTEVLVTFEHNITENEEYFSNSQQSTNTIVNMCTAILHYELFRADSPEAKASDISFLQLIEKYQETYNLVVNTSQTKLSSAEEVLVKILPPEKPIDIEWIIKAGNIISDTMNGLTNQLNITRAELFSSQETVKTQANSVRYILSAHNRIFADVRSLLKSMIKLDEKINISDITEYLASHKIFFDQLNTVSKDLVHDGLVDTKGQAFLTQIQTLIQQIPYMYDTLIKFSTEKAFIKQNKRPPLMRQEGVASSPKKRDPRTGKAVQEKNAYAVNVWRRVRMKLEGRDPDENRRLTTEEQVSWVINEAIDTENLASLYEGWTPWV